MLIEHLVLIIWTLVKVVCLIVPVMVCVAYLTLAERKVLGYMHLRLGPNRVGPWGLLQPFADGLKLLLKEIIIPQRSNSFLFILAPILSIAPALAAWAVIPFSQGLVLADINVGLLYLLAMTSVGVYGVIIAGWSANSKYAFLGSMRSAAQIVSYEIAMGFTLVGVLMLSGSMNLSKIVLSQAGGITNWFFVPLFPLFVVYWISAVAETNRAPFDVVEGESEIVAGYQVEHSGMTFALFFLAEYSNMILLSCLASILFLGGWLSPFDGSNIALINTLFGWIPGIFWLIMKTSFMVFLFLWFRATFPRYRYDQIMRLGWKIFIPVTLVWIFVLGVACYFEFTHWFAKG